MTRSTDSARMGWFRKRICCVDRYDTICARLAVILRKRPTPEMLAEFPWLLEAGR